MVRMAPQRNALRSSRLQEAARRTQVAQPLAGLDQFRHGEGRGPEPGSELARMGVDLCRHGEHLEAQPFGARVHEPRGQGLALEHGEDVVGQQVHPVPGRIGAELPARGEARAQVVLRHIVDLLDRARLRPVPADQPGGGDLPAVADHGQVLRLAAVGEEPALPAAEAQGHIAQGRGILGPVPGHEHDFAPVDGLREPLLQPGPLHLRRGADLAQLARHVGGDGEAHRRPDQVLQQGLVVAGAVPPEEAFGHAGRQRVEAPAGHLQRPRAGGDVPVPVLIGDDQILLGPQDRDRLVAPPAQVVGAGLPLVALNDRGVQVQGGPSGGPRCHRPVDQVLVDRVQGLQRGGLGGNPGSVGGPLGPGRLVVAGRQKGVEGVGGGHLAAQEADQPGVAPEDPDILHALAASGQEQHQRLELGVLREAPVADAQAEDLLHYGIQAEGEHRLGDERQARVRRQVHRLRRRFEDERQDPLCHAPAGSMPAPSAPGTGRRLSGVLYPRWHGQRIFHPTGAGASLVKPGLERF